MGQYARQYAPPMRRSDTEDLPTPNSAYALPQAERRQAAVDSEARRVVSLLRCALDRLPE